MFDFAYPTHLILLAAIAVIGLLFWWALTSKRAKLRRFGRIEVLKSLMPDASPYNPKVKIALRLIALTAIVVILARPRFGEMKSKEARTNGIEVMIAFDLSNSMLASSTDEADGVNRLDRARLLLEKLLDRLDNDKVGLVTFAGEARTQMPLTTDHYSAKLYLSELDPASVVNQGTSLTDAINLAANSFSPDDNVGKAIILITDAEDHDGNAVEAAKEALKQGIQVDVIGVGTDKGATIPVGDGESMRDRDGNVVVTRLDEDAARQIAKAGKGVYVNGASGKALEDLSDALNNLDKSEFSRVVYSAAAEQFPIFAWLALILLVADVFVLDRKIGWMQKINFFSKTDGKDKTATANQPKTETK